MTTLRAIAALRRAGFSVERRHRNGEPSWIVDRADLPVRWLIRISVDDGYAPASLWRATVVIEPFERVYVPGPSGETAGERFLREGVANDTLRRDHGVWRAEQPGWALPRRVALSGARTRLGDGWAWLLRTLDVPVETA